MNDFGRFCTFVICIALMFFGIMCIANFFQCPVWEKDNIIRIRLGWWQATSNIEEGYYALTPVSKNIIYGEKN